MLGRHLNKAQVSIFPMWAQALMDDSVSDQACQCSAGAPIPPSIKVSRRPEKQTRLVPVSNPVLIHLTFRCCISFLSWFSFHL